MRQGRLEQIGTPEEIYSQPASLRGGVVTQANFLPAQQGQMWKTEVGYFDYVAASNSTPNRHPSWLRHGRFDP